MNFESFLISICEGDLYLFTNSFSHEFINSIYKHNQGTYGFIKAEFSSKHGHKDLRPIHLACDRGNCEIIGRLILAECDIEVSSKIGNRPIHLASSRGHYEVVAMLLKEKCAINAVNKNKETALHFAAKENHLKVAKILLFEGINVEQIEATKMSALQVGESNGSHYVTQCIREWQKFTKLLNDIHNGKFNGVLKHPGFKRFYINNEMNIEATMKYIKVIDRYKTVEQLVEEIRFYHYIRTHQKGDWLMNVDIDALNRIFDQDGALVYCLSYDDICPYFCTHLIQLMLNMDEMVQNLHRMLRIIVKYSNKNIVALLEKRQKFIDIKKKALWNRMHLAVSDDRRDMIEYLLIKRHMNVNETDEIGNTPLFLACIYGHIDCAKILLAYGADLNMKNKYGQSILQVAIENGMEEFIIPLLDHVSTIDSVDILGHSALNVAIKFGSAEVYEKLITKSKVIENEISNSAPLAYLSQERSQNILLSVSLKENMASLFLKVKGYIPQSLLTLMSSSALNILDESHNSLLHLAAWNMSFTTCEGLILAGANVHLKNVYGNTPLHEVINRFLFNQTENVEECLLITIRILIKFGADVNVTNARNETSLQMALQFINKRLIREIIIASENIVLTNDNLRVILRAKTSDILHELITKLQPECSSGILTEDFIKEFVGELDFTIIEILIDQASLEIRKSIIEYLFFGLDMQNYIMYFLTSFFKYENEITDILNGETILTYFLKNGNICLCEEIVLSKYAFLHVNRKNTQNQTAFHISIHTWNLQIVERLLYNFRICDDKDNDGNTPLGLFIKHWFTEDKNLDSSYMYKLAKAFIRKGANINSENLKGKRVIDECHNNKMKKKLQKVYDKCQSPTYLPFLKSPLSSFSDLRR